MVYWIPGVALVLLVTVGVAWWGIRYEVPRLNAEATRLNRKDRLLDWRQEQLDEVARLRKRWGVALSEQKYDEAGQLQKRIAASMDVINASWKLY